jgi:hypothetical protein
MGAPSKFSVKLEAATAFGAVAGLALALADVPAATMDARPIKALAVTSALRRMKTSRRLMELAIDYGLQPNCNLDIGIDRHP